MTPTREPRDSQATVEVTAENLRRGPTGSVPELPALVVAWARERRDLVGAVLLVEGELVFGRGGEDEAGRAALVRQRPGDTAPLPAVENPRVSRRSLAITPAGAAAGGGISVAALGKLPLAVNGETVREAIVRAGDTVQLGSELLFLATTRPRTMPPLRSYARPAWPFGEPDPDGIVGESPTVWRLRDELAFAARSSAHVLVHGPSGSGKELAAQAIHRLSARGKRPMVARNTATFPEGIIDAELFGNAKNYPNPGTPEREGLIGLADGSTLFLDEIGEIAPHLQAHLLRVLDARGEYHRLGEERARTADLRVIAATNRDPGELKHDFAARLTMRIRVPSIEERRDDLPFLIDQLGTRLAAGHDDLRKTAPARADLRLTERLLRHDFPRQVRDVEQILWRAAAERSGTLGLTAAVEALLDEGSRAGEAAPSAQAEPTRDEIAAALARVGGSVTRAARELGLRNRFVLYRLLRKHGLPSDS